MTTVKYVNEGSKTNICDTDVIRHITRNNEYYS